MRESTLNIVMREISPCDGCKHFERCGHEQMACRTFAYYVRNGRFNDDMPRNPSYTTYNKIFSEDDKDFNDLIRELYKNARDGHGFE